MKKIILLFFFILFFSLLFLPQVLSLPFAKKFLEEEISKRASLSLSIEKLRCSWFGPQELSGVWVRQEKISAHLEKIQIALPLWSIKEWQEALSFQGGSLPDLQLTKIEGSLKGKSVDLSGESEKGGMFTLSGLFSSSSDFSLNLHCSAFPSALVDSLLHAKGWFSAFVGPLFAAESHCTADHIEGSLRSSALQLAVEGELQKKSLHFTKPFQLLLRPTSQLLELFREHFSLPLLGVDYSISLRIDSQGSHIPVSPFSLKEIRLPHSILDLGRFSLDLPLSFPPLVSLPAPLSVWLTPLFFSMADGKVALERVDALLGNAFHLCAWGDLNLHSSALHGTLGIPADTLESRLKISSLSPTYVLQIPVTGTFEHPEIAKSTAAAKIGALLAIQHGESVAPLFGKKGAIVGKILKNAAPPQEPEAPSPHRPFPWE
ncbi:MAG: hypothetical protein KGI80_04835 [Verrucomicrobiota bacterium]|nr:hypothetical protein [Verrucomicrobiota bacterium]